MTERFRELLDPKRLPRKITTFVLSAGAALVMACSTPDQPVMEDLPIPTTMDDEYPRPQPFHISESARAQEIVSQIQNILKPQFREINLTQKIVNPTVEGSDEMDVWRGTAGKDPLMRLRILNYYSEDLTIRNEDRSIKLKQANINFEFPDFISNEDTSLKFLIANINKGNGSWNTLVQTTASIFNMPSGLCWTYWPKLQNMETGHILPPELKAEGFFDNNYFVYSIYPRGEMFISINEVGVRMKEYRPRGTAINCQDSRSRLEERLQRGFVVVN